MSEELKDLRCKITTLAACYLEAEARAQGVDKCNLVRSILNEWEMSRHGASITAQRLLAAEGIDGADAGSSGQRRAVAGSRGTLRWDE